MKITAIIPCVALATSLFCVAAFADAPSTTTTPTTTTTTVAKPAATHVYNYSSEPVSLLVLMGTLPDTEKDKIQAIDDKLKADTEAARTSSSKEELRSKVKVLQDQANSDIAATLTADQVAAIENYAPAVTLLATSIKGGTPAITRINITTDQLNKLKAIADDRTAKQAAVRADMQQKLIDLDTAAKSQASDVLTADQKAALDTRPVAPVKVKPTAPAK